MCVQKDAVRNCCQGSCVLSEMQEAQQTENERSGPVPIGVDEMQPSLLTGNTRDFRVSDQVTRISALSFHPFSDLVSSIFHPPTS